MSNEQLMMLMAAMLYIPTRSAGIAEDLDAGARHALNRAVKIMEMGHEAWEAAVLSGEQNLPGRSAS